MLYASLLMLASLSVSETGPGQTTRVEVTPARASVRSALSGTREARLGLSSSPEARSPAGPTETGLAPALLLPHIETESIVTGTR